MNKLGRRASATTTSFTSVTTNIQIHDGHGPAAALTTIFTPPPACSKLAAPFYDTSCMPPNFNSFLSSGNDYYSPAVCPSGYTAACKLLQSQFHYYAALAPSETAVYCCPMGYLCATSDFVKGGGLCMTSSANPYAFALQIRWQDSDISNLAVVATTPATDLYFASTSVKDSTGFPAVASTTATGQIPAMSAPVAADSTAHGFSTAAKVGIGIAVPLAFLATLIGCLLLYYRRKSSRSTRLSNDLSNDHYSGGEKTVQTTHAELDASALAAEPRYELMDSRPAASEI